MGRPKSQPPWIAAPYGHEVDVGRKFLSCPHEGHRPAVGRELWEVVTDEGSRRWPSETALLTGLDGQEEDPGSVLGPFLSRHREELAVGRVGEAVLDLPKGCQLSFRATKAGTVNTASSVWPSALSICRMKAISRPSGTRPGSGHGG